LLAIKNLKSDNMWVTRGPHYRSVQALRTMMANLTKLISQAGCCCLVYVRRNQAVTTIPHKYVN